jgi:hypothetical protein
MVRCGADRRDDAGVGRFGERWLALLLPKGTRACRSSSAGLPLRTTSERLRRPLAECRCGVGGDVGRSMARMREQARSPVGRPRSASGLELRQPVARRSTSARRPLYSSARWAHLQPLAPDHVRHERITGHKRAVHERDRQRVQVGHVAGPAGTLPVNCVKAPIRTGTTKCDCSSGRTRYGVLLVPSLSRSSRARLSPRSGRMIATGASRTDSPGRTPASHRARRRSPRRCVPAE